MSDQDYLRYGPGGSPWPNSDDAWYNGDGTQGTDPSDEGGAWLATADQPLTAAEALRDTMADRTSGETDRVELGHPCLTTRI